MKSFVIKNSTGYDTRYYSSIATLVTAIEKRHFGNMKNKDIRVFLEPGDIIDSSVVLDCIARLDHSVRFALGDDEHKAWRAIAKADLETIFES